MHEPRQIVQGSDDAASLDYLAYLVRMLRENAADLEGLAMAFPDLVNHLLCCGSRSEDEYVAEIGSVFEDP